MKFQDLLAYQKSFSLAMKIFEITKSFPKEEMYSLTDQQAFFEKCTGEYCRSL